MSASSARYKIQLIAKRWWVVRVSDGAPISDHANYGHAETARNILNRMAEVVDLTMADVLASGPDMGGQTAENSGDAVDDKDVPNLGQVKALPPNLALRQDGSTVASGMTALNVRRPLFLDTSNPIPDLRGIEVWQADRLYPAGVIVLRNGGIWFSNTENTGSEPISGNPDWRLIGGTPYVDVVLTPDTITSEPFYHAGPDGPVVAMAPTPGAGLFIRPRRVLGVVGPGDAWNSDISVRLVWGESDGVQPNMADDVTLPLSVDFGVAEPLAGQEAGTEFPGTVAGPGTIINKPLGIYTVQDATGGGTTIGTRSALVRLWYEILPAIPESAQTFYHILALNQSLKTFTVNGSATGVSGAVSVVGSTADDGDYTVTGHLHQDPESDAITACDHVAKTFTVAGDHSGAFPVGSSALVEGGTDKDGRYTVVSAVFGVATVITVAEAIADLTDTADGTIGHPEQTILAVSESITSPTADGWVKV